MSVREIEIGIHITVLSYPVMTHLITEESATERVQKKYVSGKVCVHQSECVFVRKLAHVAEE